MEAASGAVAGLDSNTVATIVSIVITGAFSALSIVLGLIYYINGVRKELKGDIKKTRTDLSAENKALDTKLTSKIEAGDEKLSGEIKDLDEKLSGEIKGLDEKLSGEIKGLDEKLSGDIKEVRLASEKAHASILSELSDIKAQQAAQTERLNCVEDKIDDLKRTS